VPGTSAFAFSCVELSLVAYVMSAGAFHVIVGVAFGVTVTDTVELAVMPLVSLIV
jgi:Na+/citrate or Na+/malate symporter